MSASINPDKAVLDRLRDLLRDAKDKPMGSPMEIYDRIRGLGLNIDTIGSSQDSLVVLCVGGKPEIRDEAGIGKSPTLRVAVMHDGRCLSFDETPPDKVGGALTRRWVNERAAALDRQQIESELRDLVTLQEKLNGGQVTFSFVDVIVEEMDETGKAKARITAHRDTQARIKERVSYLMREIDRLNGREDDMSSRSVH